jgi:hypothetical protein
VHQKISSSTAVPALAGIVLQASADAATTGQFRLAGTGTRDFANGPPGTCIDEITFNADRGSEINVEVRFVCI